MTKEYSKKLSFNRERKKPKTIRLYPSDLSKLKKLSETLGTTEQLLFEEGLELIFKKYKKVESK